MKNFLLVCWAHAALEIPTSADLIQLAFFRNIRTAVSALGVPEIVSVAAHLGYVVAQIAENHLTGQYLRC
jgi:hypothetical protein